MLRRAKEHCHKPSYPDDLELHRRVLRWSGGDWFYAVWGTEYLADAQVYMDKYCWTVTTNESGTPSYDINPFIEKGLVYLTCLEALSELESEGIFGTEESREQITIALLLDDQSPEAMVRWAQMVNPPSVAKRMQAEIEAGTVASHTIHAIREAQRIAGDRHGYNLE